MMMMKCFRFSFRDDVNDPKILKSVSGPSSTSVSTDMRRFDSEVTSQSVSLSDVSVDSGNLRHPFVPTSQSPNDLRSFSLTDLKVATKNFARSSMIGEGGFGGVYKGVIRCTEDRDKTIHIAVKQLSLQGMQGHKEWVTEVNVLGVVEHQNLVKLLGYCADDDERGMQRLLIYEYMTNRSVMDHLSNKFQHNLSWSKRLKIAQDTARGLSYLHEGMDFQIIFRDFKSSNILLDEDWNAKLSDFGLARLGPEGGLSHVSTAVVGTIGYAAPEYLQTGHLTYKSDVWSYGVFLYELITGRKPVDRNRSKNEQKLLDWVRPHLTHPKKFIQIIDPRLEGKHIPKSAQKLASIANKCLSRQPKIRPKMSEVLEMVAGVVEWTETECPQTPERSGEMSTKEMLKRKLVDPIIGENGCLVPKSWRPKARPAAGGGGAIAGEEKEGEKWEKEVEKEEA